MRTLLLLSLSGILLWSPSQAQDAAVGPTRVAYGVIAGSKVGGEMPRYPAEAKAKGVSGTVHMRAVIDKKGKVENCLRH